MKNSRLSNERGSIAILLALGVVTISAFIVMQMASGYAIIRKQHANQRERAAVSQIMQRIAFLIKQSYTLAQLDPTCVSMGAHSVARKINGADFCLPAGGNLCVETSSVNGQKDYACASANDDSFNWRTGSGGAVVIGPQSSPGPQNSDVTNRITIPVTSTQRVWRSCEAPSVCVRIALCPMGQPLCSAQQAEATQIIRL